jgi:hypothetical protein
MLCRRIPAVSSPGQEALVIEAVPKGIFSSGFHLQQDGRLIADLDASSWREKADVLIDGGTFRLYREGMMSGAFILEWKGSTLARAIKPSVFSDRFELEVGKRAFTLRKESMWARRFGLFEGEQQVGRVAPAGTFTRRVLIELPTDWPMSVQAFVFWLALLMWKRESAGS